MAKLISKDAYHAVAACRERLRRGQQLEGSGELSVLIENDAFWDWLLSVLREGPDR